MKKGEDFVGIAVCFLCHDGNGKYLLAKRGKNSRDEQGTWDIGAGGHELGDTIEQTLKKEIQEEYCTDVLDFEFMGYRDVHREHDGKKTFWLMLDFIVKVDPMKAKNGEPHKLDEVGWFELSAFPTPMHSQWGKFLEKNKKWIK